MAEIPGDNGIWDWSVIPPPPEMLRLTFFPKPGTCADIRLSQRVSKTAYDKDGGVVTRDPREMFKPGLNPFGHVIDDTVDRVITGAETPPTYIDHKACEGDPYYNGDDALLDRASKGDATTNPTAGTSMTDTPGGPMDDVKTGIERIDTEFETCAICATTGRILGCIRWLSRVTRDNKGKIAILTRSHDAPASNAFLAAFYRFCQNHTDKDDNGVLRFLCPDVQKPWRAPVPDGFGKYWIMASRRLDLTRELAGGGASFGSLNEALSACVEAPEAAAIKLTCAGLQDKTTRSIAFSGQADLEASHLEPFVEDEPDMRNDFVDLNVLPTPPAFIKALAGGLLRAGKGKKGPSSPSVRLAAIAGIGTDNARGFTAPVEPKIVSAGLDAAAKTIGPRDHEIRDTLAYAGLIFGSRPDAL